MRRPPDDAWMYSLDAYLVTQNLSLSTFTIWTPTKNVWFNLSAIAEPRRTLYKEFIAVKPFDLEALLLKTPLSQCPSNVIEAILPLEQEKPAVFIDVVRAVLLYVHGGTHIDTDVMLTQPFESVLSSRRDFVGGTPNMVNGHLLHFERGSPVAEWILTEMCRFQFGSPQSWPIPVPQGHPVHWVYNSIMYSHWMSSLPAAVTESSLVFLPLGLLDPFWMRCVSGIDIPGFYTKPAPQSVRWPPITSLLLSVHFRWRSSPIKLPPDNGSFSALIFSRLTRAIESFNLTQPSPMLYLFNELKSQI